MNLHIGSQKEYNYLQNKKEVSQIFENKPNARTLFNKNYLDMAQNRI